MKFKPFFFDSNRAWGRIESLSEWQHIVLCLKISGKMLMKKACATIDTKNIENRKQKKHYGYIPNFGLYSEHISSLTLEAWAKKNNMYNILGSV